MGKTKWYTETENNTQQPGFRVGHQSHRQHRKYTPGRIFQDPLDSLPMRALLRLVYLRLRRTWIALCFQANRYTFGIFQRQTMLKFSTLAILIYALFFTDLNLPFVNSGQITDDYVAAEPVNTTLEEKIEPEGKSISWKEKSDTAPLSVYELRDEQTQNYIERFGSIAVQEMKKYGIPASISLAQGLVESRSGTSRLAQRNNNHFGMKCFSKKCRKGHCSNFSDDHHKDFFRIFKNPWESWRAHSQMLAAGRYVRLKKYGRDYRSWARGLEQLGYATDRSYSEKLIGVIEKYQLHRFDRQ